MINITYASITQFQQLVELKDYRQPTKKEYVRYVRKLAEHFQCDPATLTEDQIRQYFLFLRQHKRYKSSPMKAAKYALLCFFLDCVKVKGWTVFKEVRIAQAQVLPVVLSRTEVQSILTALTEPRFRTCLRLMYHSCNHRACPQCGHARASEWIAKQKLKLLPVPYYLITFTVPEALRAWLRSHQKLGYALLLRESAGALRDVARNPKHLGGETACLSVLHTWGRQLQYHPHIHCVVPAGGLREDGLRWMRPKSPDFFLPQIVLAARFRNRLKLLLAQEHPEEFTQIPTTVWRQKWVVDVQPVGSGEAALKYLSA